MNGPELTWFPMEPTEGDLAFMALLDEEWQRMITAFALSPAEIGEVDSLHRKQRTSRSPLCYNESLP